MDGRRCGDQRCGDPVSGTPLTVQRRTFIIAGTALVLGGANPPRGAAYAADVDPFADIEAALGGRIGVAAVDTRNGARLAHRGGERFAMCSTFKWLLAAAVLARVDHDAAHLEQQLSYSQKDLVNYSPVTELHLAAGSLSIRELCQAAVEVSDNTAANTLLKYLGGPGALTAYARQLGDPITRLDRIETSLNTNLPGDPRDTSTPDAMTATMRKVLVGDALSPTSRGALLDWLKHCQTGLHRLRAGLPRDWVVGDKTGTGDNGAANDLAIIWPPRRPPILMVAYCDAAAAAPAALDAAHARIGRVVAAAFA
jgi:beta-lactamase class A